MTSAADYLSSKEKRAAIEMALEGGMEPKDIFKAVLSNVWGPTERRNLVVQWGKRMGLESSEALRIAAAAALIPSPHPPKSRKK